MTTPVPTPPPEPAPTPFPEPRPEPAPVPPDRQPVRVVDLPPDQRTPGIPVE